MKIEGNEKFGFLITLVPFQGSVSSHMQLMAGALDSVYTEYLIVAESPNELHCSE